MVPAEINRETVSQMTKEDLEALVLSQHRQICRLTGRLARALATKESYYKTIERKKDQLCTAKEKIDQLRNEKTQSVEKIFQGKQSRYFTVRGGLSLALRRTMAGIGSNRLGLVLQEDLGRRAVTSAEVRLRASLLAATRSFNKDCRARLMLEADADHEDLEVPEGAPAELKSMLSWRFSMYSIRGDATNAFVWQSRKLRCQEVQSWFCCDAVCAWDLPEKAI
eukprot:6720910-Pyramimonas_sp.AAC.1